MNHSSIENHSTAPVPRAVVFADIFSLLVIGFLAGSFGNGRACFLLRKRRDLRKAPHFLLANLSVIGFLSSIISIFGWLVLIVICHILNLQIPEVLCFIVIPFAFACIMLNAMTLSLMAIDRQDCVLRPFHRRLTPHNVKTVILVTWLVAFVFPSVFVFFEAYANDSVCQTFDPYSLTGKLTSRNSYVTYLLLSATLLNVATFFTIVITLIRILEKLRSSPISHSNSIQNRRERRITNNTYRLCAVFAVCWLPAVTCNLLVRFGGFDFAEMKAAHVLTVTIAKFHYVLNPFLHHKMLKARTANQIFPVAALNDRRTLAGVHHPTCRAVVPLANLRSLGSEFEEPGEFSGIPTRQNSPCNSQTVTEPATTTPWTAKKTSDTAINESKSPGTPIQLLKTDQN